MRSSRGFTLTELLVVIAIIILLVAVSIPSFLNASRAGRLSSAVRSVQAMLMGARNLAIAYNAVYSVEFGLINLQQHQSGSDLRINDDDDWLNDGVHGWKPDERGYFVTVQCEQPDNPNDPNQGDVIVREPIILPTGVVLAFNAHATKPTSPNDATWTAIGPIPGNTGRDSWDDTSVGRHDDECPDIAFQGDGTCADAEGEGAIVLYDATEEVDSDGTVAAAVITVVKYTGEVVIETVRAKRADLQ